MMSGGFREKLLYERIRARYDARVLRFGEDAKAFTREKAARTREQERLPERAGEQAVSACSVSVIIPSKDHPAMLASCLQALARTVRIGTDCKALEIIVPDNGSNAENRSKINDILECMRRRGFPARYLYREEPFSFSRMCNAGAQAATGELLLFLNDDVEALSEGWLGEMAVFALAEGAGAIGAKLLYPGEERLIQHAGIANTRVGPVHCLHYATDKREAEDGFNRRAVFVIAVTGACLMLRSALFAETGGFREELPVAFNDVDLCYRLFEAGRSNICCNACALLHHESVSRGDDAQNAGKMLRLGREYRTLMTMHRALIGYDPYRTDSVLSDADLLYEYGLRDAGTSGFLPCAKRMKVPKGAVLDPVARVGVEYAGPLWLVMTREETERAGDSEDRFDYYIRGYSFVIGADNALYTRRLLLQRIRLTAEGEIEDTREEMLAYALHSFYRPDIVRNAPDQVRAGMSGFHARIARNALRPGIYRVGVLSKKRCSGQLLYDWGKTLLYVDDGTEGLPGSI